MKFYFNFFSCRCLTLVFIFVSLALLSQCLFLFALEFLTQISLSFFSPSLGLSGLPFPVVSHTQPSMNCVGTPDAWIVNGCSRIRSPYLGARISSWTMPGAAFTITTIKYAQNQIGDLVYSLNFKLRKQANFATFKINFTKVNILKRLIILHIQIESYLAIYLP